MVVDNRYSGVGYDPPFETPTDKDFMAGHIEALKEENEQLRDRIAELEAEIKSYRAELSKEMPSDFKDWWQNSKKEWPLVARLVLETRRKHIAELGASLDRFMNDNADLTVKLHESRNETEDVRFLLKASRENSERLSGELDALRAAVEEIAQEAHSMGRIYQITLSPANPAMQFNKVGEMVKRKIQAQPSRRG